MISKALRRRAYGSVNDIGNKITQAKDKFERVTDGECSQDVFQARLCLELSLNTVELLKVLLGPQVSDLWEDRTDESMDRREGCIIQRIPGPVAETGERFSSFKPSKVA